MKKIFTFMLIAVGLMTAATANAQLNFGVKAGLNVTDMHLSNEVFDKSNNAGWFAGPTVKFTLPIVGLGVDASALYDYRSAKLTSDGEEQTVKQQQIAIPVNLRYGFGLGDAASVYLFAGPQWGINVGDKDFKWTKGSSYSLKSSNFSVNVGLGAMLLNHLQVSANYNIACGKTAEAKWTNAVDYAKSRNNAWQIAVAYYF